MSKILVADDSRFQVALLTQALQEKGFEVVAAQDPMQAGMLALRTAPDAIVLNINIAWWFGY
jgi:PleD family two-component response regulator